MAHSTNRSIDFAPAWLKLPEATQNSKKQEQPHNPTHNSQQAPHSPPYHHRHSISHTEHSCLSDPPNYSQFQRTIPTPNQQHHSRPTGGRAHIHSYRSGPSSGPQHPTQLQRSQSTGSYSESTSTRLAPAPINTAPANKPLEEEFPLLCSGPAAPSVLNQSRTNQGHNTAQWRIKERTREDTSNKNSFPSQQNDNLLTSNISGGKVYRAQVKPVKRTNMIPMSNGSNGTSTVNATIKARENGEHEDCSPLSSSLDKEKKFLEELGWREDEESDDDCGIPEQDPAKLEQIMMQAKLARQRILQRNKQGMKVAPSAVLPNEDDLASSSDNSDNE
ncbi:vasculin-like [Watersipora subatra]|uniref:vasculin-like n=1 Tax=Watersipora subatra TaxID=2589382 RepID=UPI00355B4FFD